MMRASIARIRALILEPPRTPLRRRVAYPLYVLRVAIQLGKQWARDKCPQIAASLAFQSALSLVPVLAVTSALLSATGALSAQSALVDYLSNQVFPAVGEDFFHHLMAFVQNVRTGALGPFGLAITIVLAYTLFHSVENVFGQIWQVQRGRPLLAKFLIFYTLATLMPFLVGLSLYQTARYFQAVRGSLFSFASIWLALNLVNKLLPRTQVRWRAALAGATVSALLFELAKFGYTRYVTVVALAGYHGVYGAVAIIPISLVWMYVAWLVILFGAECAHAAQNLRVLEALDRRAHGDDPRDKVNGVVALRVLAAVAAHYQAGGKALSEDELARRFDVAEDVIQLITEKLKSRDLLVEVQGDVTGLFLARPPEQITLEQVLADFRSPDVRADQTSPRLDALLRALEQTRREQVGALTLADLLTDQPASA